MNKWCWGSLVETQFKDRQFTDLSKTGVGEHGVGAQTAGACVPTPTHLPLGAHSVITEEPALALPGQ